MSSEIDELNAANVADIAEIHRSFSIEPTSAIISSWQDPFCLF